MVNDMGPLVGAISIDDLVLVAQNVRAGADAASVVGFHAVGRVERRGRGFGSLPRFRDGTDHLCLWRLVASCGGLVASGAGRRLAMGLAAFLSFNAAFGQLTAAVNSPTIALTTSLGTIPLLERVKPVFDERPELAGAGIHPA